MKEKQKERKKERTNQAICSLLHRKTEEKKTDKLAEKQAHVTTQRFLQFLYSSAGLCIFWIYIDCNKEKKRKWEDRHF